MTQPMTPTHPLTSTTADASADWRGFAAAIRESLLAEQPAWATISGVITTHPPYTAPTDTPPAAVPSVSTAPKSSPPTMGASTAARPADTANAAPRTDLDDILDFVEAEAEAAAALMADVLPPVPDGTGKEAAVYTLRPAVALAVTRLAATFGSPAALYKALSAPGSLTVLSADTPGLDETLYKVLDHTLSRAPFWPEDAPRPKTVRAEDAVVSKDSRKSGESPIGQLVPAVRTALETRRAIIAVAVAAGTLPTALRALTPKLIRLTALDRAMLAGILTDAYSDTGSRGDDDRTDTAALARLPDDAHCKGLGPDDLGPFAARRWRVPSRPSFRLRPRIRPMGRDWRISRSRKRCANPWSRWSRTCLPGRQARSRGKTSPAACFSPARRGAAKRKFPA